MGSHGIGHATRENARAFVAVRTAFRVPLLLSDLDLDLLSEWMPLS